MKKSFILFICLAASVGAFAQTAVRFGLKAGIDFANFSDSEPNGASISTQSLFGYTAGGAVNIEFKHFIIQPAFLFMIKGDQGNDGQIINKLTLKYLEIPVNFLYKLQSGTDNILIGGGLYWARGISGRSTVKGEMDGGKVRIDTARTEHFGSGVNDIKNPDVGISFMAGYQFQKHVLINVGYEIGLSSLSNNPAGGKIHNQVISLGLGYFF